MQKASSVGSYLWIFREQSSSSRNLTELEESNSLIVPTFLDVDRGLKRERTSGNVAVELEPDPHQPKVYKRRFYILFLFSLVSFMQYCSWNTYGPISNTCMAVFDWTEREIALMASLDPITYILFMILFSWVMDVKGLRISMLLAVTSMAVGTGLRCLTSDNNYVTWTMAAGQFFNGLAGPVAQAAPPLMSGNWFPSTERTTATAVAALCGSLGVAFSFIIGPTVVEDFNLKDYRPRDPYENVTAIFRRENKSLNGPLYLSDTVFIRATHYWPMNLQLSKLQRKQRFENFKQDKNGHIILQKPRKAGKKTTISRKTFWLSINGLNFYCYDNLLTCYDGFTLTFWVNYDAKHSGLQRILSTRSVLDDPQTGFLVAAQTEMNQTNKYCMLISFYTDTEVRTVNLTMESNCWSHVAVTWKRISGITVLLDGNVPRFSHTSSGKGNVNHTSNEFPEMKSGVEMDNDFSLSDIALWEKTLDFSALKKIFLKTDKSLCGQKSEELNEELIEIIKSRKEDVMNLLYVEFAVNAGLFILVFIYFPGKPPVSPSLSANERRDDFLNGTKSLLRNPQFWALALIYGITTGVYSGWGAVLNVNLSSFGITQKESGWLGCYAVLAGIGAGMLLARCADVLTGKMKLLLVVLFIGSTSCFLWFCLLCLRFIPYSRDSLYKAAILGGTFVSGTIPLFYELTIEQTYPIAEGITTGVLTLINNIVTMLYLLVLIIPGVGTTWMNWALFGSFAVSLPALFVFKENYNRLTVDLGTEQNGESETQPDDSHSSLKYMPTDVVNKETVYIQTLLRNPHDNSASLLSLPRTQLNRIFGLKWKGSEIEWKSKHTPIKLSSVT